MWSERFIRQCDPPRALVGTEYADASRELERSPAPAVSPVIVTTMWYLGNFCTLNPKLGKSPVQFYVSQTYIALAADQLNDTESTCGTPEPGAPPPTKTYFGVLIPGHSSG